MNNSKFLPNFTCNCGVLRWVEVVKDYYPTGDLGLRLYVKAEGVRECLMVPTCLIPGIPEGCVAIRDEAENRGVLRELTNAGVIDDPHAFIGGIPICRVLFE
jgi:hypothetical protein